MLGLRLKVAVPNALTLEIHEYLNCPVWKVKKLR